VFRDLVEQARLDAVAPATTTPRGAAAFPPLFLAKIFCQTAAYSVSTSSLPGTRQMSSFRTLHRAVTRGCPLPETRSLYDAYAPCGHELRRPGLRRGPLTSAVRAREAPHPGTERPF